jgi:large subunit ribosomal protein L21
MYAVIKTGGKQYRVAQDDVITVERLAGDAGADVTFDEVLMVGDKAGSPTVEGASVTGKIVEQTRGDKIIVFKKKRRKDYKRTAGHRQDLTVVQITDIAAAAKKKAAAKKAPVEKADEAAASEDSK